MQLVAWLRQDWERAHSERYVQRIFCPPEPRGTECPGHIVHNMCTHPVLLLFATHLVSHGFRCSVLGGAEQEANGRILVGFADVGVEGFEVELSLKIERASG